MNAPSPSRPEDAEVLLVDDDPDLRESMEMLLTMEGYRVGTASDGVTALAWLQRAATAPRLALIDLMMPGMDGFTLRSRMRATPGLAHIPVVVITGAGVLAERRAAELEAKVLRKPIALETLLATVRHHCGDPLPPAA